jgi:hypothetical protein
VTKKPTLALDAIADLLGMQHARGTSAVKLLSKIRQESPELWQQIVRFTKREREKKAA